jgi:hypothetical protein
MHLIYVLLCLSSAGKIDDLWSSSNFVASFGMALTVVVC